MGNPQVNYGKRAIVLPFFPMSDQEPMGQRIRSLREAKRLTLQGLGDAVGVTKSAIHKWESGDTQNMRLINLMKLCDVLGTDPHYLIFGADSSRPVAQPRRSRSNG